VNIHHDIADGIKNKYEAYTHIADSLFRTKINKALTILNLGKIGSGKSYSTAIILRNLVSKIKNKGMTEIFVFNPSGDKTYDVLKDAYKSQGVKFHNLNSVEELNGVIQEMKKENEKNEDIDADYIDKKTKQFIIRRIFIFDDVGD